VLEPVAFLRRLPWADLLADSVRPERRWCVVTLEHGDPDERDASLECGPWVGDVMPDPTGESF
jgi:hypothetical protein